MIDLSNLTIIIPFQKDSEDRLQNLKTIIRYFSMFFINIDIKIIERGETSHTQQFASDSVQVTFVGNTPTFHRTAYFNMGATQSTRPYITCYDTDVIFKPEAIQATLKKLEQAPFVFPHNGLFLDIQNPTKEAFIATFDFNLIPVFNQPKPQQKIGDVECIHTKSLGGATFFDKDFFLKAGGYNEQFVSWGWEDNEIVNRFTKLGFVPANVPFSCYHLTHQRGKDSTSTHEHFKNNYKEFKHVFCLTPAETGAYVQKKLNGSLPQTVLDNLPKNTWLSPLKKWWRSWQI